MYDHRIFFFNQPINDGFPLNVPGWRNFLLILDFVGLNASNGLMRCSRVDFPLLLLNFFCSFLVSGWFMIDTWFRIFIHNSEELMLKLNLIVSQWSFGMHWFFPMLFPYLSSVVSLCMSSRFPLSPFSLGALCKVEWEID